MWLLVLIIKIIIIGLQHNFLWSNPYNFPCYVKKTGTWCNKWWTVGPPWKCAFRACTHYQEVVSYCPLCCVFSIIAYYWCSNDASKFCSAECQMVMNVLWTRLGERGANWRHVYKVSFLKRNDNVELIADEFTVCIFSS